MCSISVHAKLVGSHEKIQKWGQREDIVSGAYIMSLAIWVVSVVSLLISLSGATFGTEGCRVHKLVGHREVTVLLAPANEDFKTK